MRGIRPDTKFMEGEEADAFDAELAIMRKVDPKMWV